MSKKSDRRCPIIYGMACTSPRDHSALVEARYLGLAKRLLVGVVYFYSRSSLHRDRSRAIEEAEGDLKEARALYTEAAQRWADYGFVLEEGRRISASHVASSPSVSDKPL
jgi:hypothetical protein